MRNTIARHGKSKMSRYKRKDDAIRLAAAILGKKGGSMRTEKQTAAHRESIAKANAALTGATPEETAKIRSSIQMQIPEAKRIARAKNAVTARWKSRPEAMSADEFRGLTAGLTAAKIAELLGITVAKVNSWRRAVKPVTIREEDAANIRNNFSHKN